MTVIEDLSWVGMLGQGVIQAASREKKSVDMKDPDEPDHGLTKAKCSKWLSLTLLEEDYCKILKVSCVIAWSLLLKWIPSTL